MENELCGVAVGLQPLLAEEGVSRFATVLCYGDGAQRRLPVTTPAKDLIAATEIDYRGCRKEIRHLRYERPLFEERLDIPVADFCIKVCSEKTMVLPLTYNTTPDHEMIKYAPHSLLEVS